MPRRPLALRTFSPLRYPGGKGRLSYFLQLLFKENQLSDGHYAEPYAGGAAIALSLLIMEFASTIHINDISKPVYHFWRSALHDTDRLCKLIHDTNVTVDEWKRQRAIFQRPHSHSALQVGFALFFLNRTNRSGIVHTGGVIGGNDQSGAWKIDARYNKTELMRRVNTIAMYRNRIQVTNLDAEKFIADRVNQMPAKSLIFLDPPYFVQGHNLYENHYSARDHIRLAKLVKQRLNRKWIVSYDNHPEIRKAYAGCNKLCYSLSYSAARRYEGSEVMFFSGDLTVPRVASPIDMES